MVQNLTHVTLWASNAFVMVVTHIHTLSITLFLEKKKKKQTRGKKTRYRPLILEPPPPLSHPKYEYKRVGVGLS